MSDAMHNVFPLRIDFEQYNVAIRKGTCNFLNFAQYLTLKPLCMTTTHTHIIGKLHYHLHIFMLIIIWKAGL